MLHVRMLPLVLAYSISDESEPEGVFVTSKLSGITDAFRGKGDFALRKRSGVCPVCWSEIMDGKAYIIHPI